VAGGAKFWSLNCPVTGEEGGRTVLELRAFGMGRDIMVVVIKKEKVPDSGSARTCVMVSCRTLKEVIVADSGEHGDRTMCKL